MSLARSYVSALGSGVDLEGSKLEGRLSELYARGAAAHPSLSIDSATFARHLALCRAVIEPGARSPHVEDLFLVCAALAGESAAIVSLRRRYHVVVVNYLRRIDSTLAARKDIEDQVWGLLLAGDGGRPPKLARYSGKGELAGFIGVSAQRFAFTAVRHSAAYERALTRARAEAMIVSGDPELTIIKERYRLGFEQAVRDALAILDDRARMMLRMLVVDGQSMDRIAEVYRVNQSSISRRLEKVRKEVATEVRRLLRERLSVAETEFDSIANLVRSQLELTISRVLNRS